MPNVEHSSISFSGLSDGNHVDQFPSRKRIVRMDSCVFDIGKRALGMYSVTLQRLHNRDMTTLDVTRE